MALVLKNMCKTHVFWSDLRRCIIQWPSIPYNLLPIYVWFATYIASKIVNKLKGLPLLNDPSIL